MIDWMFIPTWCVIVVVLIGMGWMVWNFDNEVDDLQEEVQSLRKLLKQKENDADSR